MQRQAMAHPDQCGRAPIGIRDAMAMVVWFCLVKNICTHVGIKFVHMIFDKTAEFLQAKEARLN
ncbi:hypothetical protein GCM10009096_07790 [Parasphingorhabdus litoris]|uniref:Uncharacterized protein n=1 Tax=Parasphingorhabdus litoris TaxID=394733 RepID=A0ABN1A7C7_9SPHN